MSEKKVEYTTARPKEHNHQAQLFNWATWQGKMIPELTLMFAIPNGGKRPKVVNQNGVTWSPEGVKMKREGVKRGVPDIFLPVARKGYHGLFIEMKRPGEKPRPDQVEWLDALQAQGYLATVCDGFDDARVAILEYLEVHSNIRMIA